MTPSVLLRVVAPVTPSVLLRVVAPEALNVPLISSFFPGLVVPIPTLPVPFWTVSLYALSYMYSWLLFDPLPALLVPTSHWPWLVNKCKPCSEALLLPILNSPVISNLCRGLVFPIPILPLFFINILLAPPVWKYIAESGEFR